MKKLNTLLIMLFAFFAMNFVLLAAPDLVISVGDKEVSGGINDDLEIHGVVKNTNQSDYVYTMLKVYLKQREEGQSLMICWGDQCLPPIEEIGLTKFSEEVAIMPGGTSEDKFHCTVDQGGVEGDMVVTFVFYNKFNPNDSAAFTTTVHIGATDVNDDNEISLTITPNPAIDFININNIGTNASTIQIYDITGLMINSINVNQNQGNILVNTNTLPSGIYFLNVINRNGTTKTKRFVISK